MNSIISPKRFGRVIYGAVLSTTALSAVLLGATVFGNAIYTTLSDGTPVNHNIYERRQDVYLSGGPNNSSSQGLPSGEYYFQITDPSGKTLLSSDPAACRVLVVNAAGRVDGVPGPGCFHNVGTDGHTVQMYPFDQTPNPGGEYKAWLIPVDEAEIDEGDPKVLSFRKSSSKTDNFKVEACESREGCQ